MPQRHRVVDDLQPVGEQPGGRWAIVHLKRQHPREIAHLAGGQLTLRVRGEPGIHDPSDLGVGLEMLGDGQRTLLVGGHPDR